MIFLFEYFWISVHSTWHLFTVIPLTHLHL